MAWLRPILQEKFDELATASYIYQVCIQSEVHGLSKMLRIVDELISLIEKEKDFNNYEQELKENLPKFKEALIKQCQLTGTIF